MADMDHGMIEKDLNFQSEQLHQSQKMEALGTLVSGVAHEINNPVNLIMYSVPILRKVLNDVLPLLKRYSIDSPGKTFGGLTYGYLEENLGQILSDVELAADRITKIVGDLKNFARQTNIRDTGSMEINLAVENSLRLAQPTIRKSRIHLDVALNPDIPPIKGNLQSIEQIALNLTINAIQAINHDNGHIEVSTAYDPLREEVILEVSDNGRGVNPEIADKLFNPFITDKQAEGGTGLGLSVTYNLVKAHRGDIRFSTTPGKGSTFTAYFPTLLSRRRPKILVVDDDDSVREMLVHTLRMKSQYVVDEAPDGINACIKLGSFKPHLLILDVFMPEMNGLEVCRVIKSDPELSDLKVIITTGQPSHRLIDEVTDLGFETILGKPFQIEHFWNIVENLLEMPS